MRIATAMEFKYPKYFTDYGINFIRIMNKLPKINIHNKKEVLNFLRYIYLNYSEFSNYSFLIYTSETLIKKTYIRIKRLKPFNIKKVYTWNDLFSHLKNFEIEIYKKFYAKESIKLSLIPIHLHEGLFSVNVGDIYEELCRIFIYKNKNISEFKVSLEHILFNHDDYLKMAIKAYVTLLKVQDV